MRNYVQIWYCRLTFAFYSNGVDWQATFNKDIIGDSIEDCAEQVRVYIAEQNIQFPPPDLTVVWDAPIEKRFVLLDKDNLISLMKIGTALQQVSPENSRTWMEGNNQAGIDIATLWRLESPRLSWSHGH
jgi:hypothetical protein